MIKINKTFKTHEPYLNNNFCKLSLSNKYTAHIQAIVNPLTLPQLKQWDSCF